MKSLIVVPLLVLPLTACPAQSSENKPFPRDADVLELQDVITLEACELPEGVERFEILSFQPSESGVPTEATLQVEVAGDCGADYYQACWNRRFEDGAVQILLGRRHEGEVCDELAVRDVRLDLSAIDRELSPHVIGTTDVALQLEGGRRLGAGAHDQVQHFEADYQVRPFQATEQLDIAILGKSASEGLFDPGSVTVRIESKDGHRQLVPWISTVALSQGASLRIRPGTYRISAIVEPFSDSGTPWQGAYPNMCATGLEAVLSIEAESESTQTSIDLTLYPDNGAKDPCYGL